MCQSVTVEQRRRLGQLVAAQHQDRTRFLMRKLGYLEEDYPYERIEHQRQDRDGEQRSLVTQLVSNLAEEYQLDMG